MKSQRSNTGIIMLTIIILGILGIGAYLLLQQRRESVEPLVGETPVTVVQPAQDANGLRVDSPLPLSVVSRSFTIMGTLDMSRDIQRRWIVFEGQAGRIEIRNPESGELVLPVIPFTLSNDWMDIAMNGGTMEFSIPVQLPEAFTGPLNIIFIEDDPSGELAVVNTLMLTVSVQ